MPMRAPAATCAYARIASLVAKICAPVHGRDLTLPPANLDGVEVTPQRLVLDSRSLHARERLEHSRSRLGRTSSGCRDSVGETASRDNVSAALYDSHAPRGGS